MTDDERRAGLPATMSDEALRQAYNAHARPNVYGDELARRIDERDAVAFGMSADNERLRS